MRKQDVLPNSSGPIPEISGLPVIQKQSINCTTRRSENSVLRARSASLFEFEGQLNRNQGGGMVDGAPRTQLQHRSLRSGMPSYPH